MDDAFAIGASAFVGVVLGYGVRAWQKLPRIPKVDTLMQRTIPGLCEHRFDTMHRDGRWRCGICGKQRGED